MAGHVAIRPMILDAENAASRRALEKNGFELVEVRPIATEPHARPMAIYRLVPSDRW